MAVLRLALVTFILVGFLFNSIIDYTNNTELEQKVKVIEQKHNELVDTVNELKAKVETYSDKINELEERVHRLENASQS